MLKVSLDLLNVLDPIKQETAVIGSNTSTSSRSAQLDYIDADDEFLFTL